MAVKSEGNTCTNSRSSGLVWVWLLCAALLWYGHWHSHLHWQWFARWVELFWGSADVRP